MGNLCNYRFELNKVNGEPFGVLKLLDEKGQVVGTNASLSRLHYSTEEASLDLFKKAIEMLLKRATIDDSPLLKQILNETLNISITCDGKPIKWWLICHLQTQLFILIH